MQTPESNTPLAIIGIGCLFPKAAGPGFYWANVKHGVDCITEVPSTHWDPADYFDADPKRPDMTYARRGGFLDAVDFNPMEFGIAPRDIEATDTTQLLGLVAAKQALTDAGVVLNPSPQPPPRNGEGALSPSPGGGGVGEGSAGAGGLGRRPVDRSRVSVILGVTGTLELVIPLGARLGHPKWKRAMQAAGIPQEQIEDAASRIAESYVPWQENSFPGLLGNVVAGRIANRLDLQGTNCVVDAACASSLSAVHLAALELQANRADVVVTGGCDTFNDIFMYMCFSKTPALSATGDAKPFDANGDGTILGEGLGVVVLKRLADAERDGDTIYAVIRGIGSSSDGKGNAVYAPSAEGQRRCLLTTYRNAGVTPDTIELVEAHGTGTRVGDATEATALTEVYSDGAKPRPWAAIGSVKSQIGHTKAAAGSASLIKAALALYYKVLPPTIKVAKPVEPLADPNSPFYVNTQMRPWLPRAEHPRRAAMSAFGFGGSNFHAVLEEHDSAKREVDWDGSVEVVALGADSPQALAAELAKVEALLDPSPNPLPQGERGLNPAPPFLLGKGVGGLGSLDWPAFARFAEQSRASFEPAAKCRLCFAAHRTQSDLPKLLAGAKARLAAEPDAVAWHTPEGAHYGAGPAPGKLAVLFPGQGSQSVGMLRDLACLFPELLDTLATANAAANDTLDSQRLSDRIYPPPSFDPEAKKQHDADLRATRNAQPALGAVSYGTWRVLSERFGLAADAFAGHSYGELVALAAAGCYHTADLFTLSRLRGRLMGEQRGGDAGAMLAVLAPLADIERILHDRTLDLVVANKNAPKQTVLSGSTPEIERAARAFTDAGMKCARLPVAAAFHSRFVADAATPFRAALEGVNFAPGSVPVFANTTAAVYPSDPNAARDLLANQLASPVAFVEQLRAMAASGVRTFVEVGPGVVLTRLTEATLTDAGVSGFEAFALEASGGKRSGVLDLGNVLARLAARGHCVTLTAWEAGSRCRPAPVPAGKPGLTVALTGANYVTPRPARPPRPATLNGVNGKHKEPLWANPERERRGVASTPSLTVGVRQELSPKAATMSDSDPNALAQALLMTQQSLAALQRMQEQTAALHKQFLESQETAQRTLQSLVDQQQALLLSGLGAGVALPAPALRPPAPAPVPSVVAPPAPALSATPVVPVMPAVMEVAPRRVAPPPKPAAPVSSNGAPGRDHIANTLLAVVSEKTGYPAESLDLSLSLDADLGVDSIKRVEILSALQEKLPGAPVVKPEHLGTLHTLRDVAAFLAGPGDSAAVVPVESAPPTAGLSTDVISGLLLEVIAEKTGYPVASLDPGMSLDADLGVDSIKRVEILAAVKERLPEAPEVKAEHLGTLHTIRDVADFLSARSPLTAPNTAKIPISLVTPATEAPHAETVADVAELSIPETEHVDSIRTQTAGLLSKMGRGPDAARQSGQRSGVVEHAYRTGAALAADRVDRSILHASDLDLNSSRPRVAIPRGSEIWVVGDRDPLADSVAEILAGQGFKPKRFAWSSAASAPTSGPLAALVLIAPLTVEAALNRQAFAWLKLAAPKLRQSGRAGAALFAAVMRLDGAFGLADLSADADPTPGGLAGLVKTARHEWPEVACKAIDLDPAFATASTAAAAVVDELLTQGPVEVGVARNHRSTLDIARTARRAGPQLINLGPKDVILITGGARGVTAEAAVALAETYAPTLILTGRTPMPGSEPEWLAGLSTEAELKKAIAERLGADAAPRRVGEQYHLVIAQREVRRTLERIQETGAKVAYFPVDITDTKAVSELLQHVRAKFGPVTALVHGAGVLADKRIEDLTAEQFDHVYRTKVDGLRYLLDSLAREELKALVLFSSTTARFGRTGQVAYACANEVLNKTAQVEARRRLACRVVSVNWGPWDGGMVTPALRKVFENEGVGVIPLLDGAVFLVQELNAAGKAVEVIALGKSRGGSGTIPVPAGMSTATPPPVGASPGGSGVVASTTTADLSLAFERVVDVATHPVLKGHVIDGRAVVPMALHLEWLAHAALHGNPGLVFHGFNDLRVTHGVQVESGASVQLRAFAGRATRQDRLFLVPVELRGRRKDGREVIHARGEIVLVSALPAAPPADRPPPVSQLPYSVPQAYRDHLFHGPELHGIERLDGFSETAFIGAAFPAPAPAEWLQSPLRSAWVADPLVLDASFQMMILWTQTQHDTASLPCFAGRYRQYRKTFPTDPTTVVIRVRRDDGKFARADIDYLDPEGRVIAQMQDYECVMEKTLNQAFRKNQLVKK